MAAALEAAAFPCACTALGALAVVALRRPAGERASRVLLGFSAGVMLAACLFSLLLPAIEQASEERRFPGWLPAAAGMLLGVVFLAAPRVVIRKVNPVPRAAQPRDCTIPHQRLLYGFRRMNACMPV